MLDFADCFYQPVAAEARGARVGTTLLAPGDAVAGVPGAGALSGAALREALAEYARRSGGGYQPQLAALAFFIAGAPAALAGYFPLTTMLDAAGQAELYALAGALADHPHFDLRLIGEGRREATHDLPRDTRWIVAGQVAEIFFFRRDILARLLASPRPFRLYTTPRAFAEGGGVAGGCYNAATGAVQLLLARVYEGFYGRAPGVAPLLHEFGHMLDHFDAGRAAFGRSAGLLPGMRPSDGACYTPRARELFLAGKRTELERYNRRRAGASGDADLPIGHPYVFQNDTEFIAGYLELFLRSPHAFAAMNPTLFGGLAALLGYDPRGAWAADFRFYIDENRRYYLGGQQPPPAGLTPV
ncbi:hypothetical protein [Kouleothrix sp.]|uniref:hypothetical protein n=1 Tax=Kouleothrix sp. TaxID=2779161 RepID=UPI00391DCEAA